MLSTLPSPTCWAAVLGPGAVTISRSGKCVRASITWEATAKPSDVTGTAAKQSDLTGTAVKQPDLRISGELQRSSRIKVRQVFQAMKDGIGSCKR